MLDSVLKLSEKTAFLGNSAIALNMGYIMRLSWFEDVGIDFAQVNLFNSVFKQVESKIEANHATDIRATGMHRGTVHRRGAETFPLKEEICPVLKAQKYDLFQGADQEPNGSGENSDNVLFLNKVFVDNILLK